MTRLFNAACQRDRPLSRALGERLRESGLEQNLRSMTTVDEVNAFAQQLPETLKAIRPKAPVLIDPPQQFPVRREGWRAVPGTNSQEAMFRHSIAIAIDGDHHLITRWPDDVDDVEPIDSAAQAEFAAVSDPGDEDYRRLRDMEDTWSLARSGSNQHEWAIFTSILLSRQEEREIADGVREIQTVFDRRIAVARQVVAKVAEQTDHYFDASVPEHFASAIADRREELTHRASVAATLSFPSAWRPVPPKLAPPTPDAESVDATANPVPTPPLTVCSRRQFDPASFDDVQRVIRVWANAVERYPDAFRPLGEDRISDLLAATLNATMPGANREVYSQNGKSDIFIHADVLAAGAGPAKVFICESKIARSEKIVHAALQPQLFSYLNTHDTAAVLLLLMPQKDLRRAESVYLKVLRAVPGFIQQTPGTAGWPIFDFRVDGRVVHVCIATVHIAPPNPAVVQRRKARPGSFSNTA